MLIQGDCTREMQKLIHKGVQVDLIITDPPYLMNYKTNGRKNKNHKFTTTIANDNNPKLITTMIKQCYQLLKEGGAIYIFCNDRHIDEIKPIITKYFTFKNILIWVKNNWTAGDLKGQYAKRTEYIIYATKGQHHLNGKRDTDVLTFKRITGKQQVHQNQKPLKLIKYLIQKSSKKGDTILDCFMGSGTTLLASKQLLRNYIGIEIDPTYYRIAQKRLLLNK